MLLTSSSYTLQSIEIWNYCRSTFFRSHVNEEQLLKFQLWFHPLWGPQQPGALWGGPSPEGVWRDIFELLAKAGSQGLAWAPCPGQPHSGPCSPELPAEDLPTLKAQDGPPPRAPGCCGPQSGWNHNWNFKFRLQFQINRNDLHDEVLEIFFAGNTKENCKSLKWCLFMTEIRPGWINIGILSF